MELKRDDGMNLEPRPSWLLWLLLYLGLSGNFVDHFSLWGSRVSALDELRLY